MPPKVQDDSDWSDSEDEEIGSDEETSVLLGIPDGVIEEKKDVRDPSVSRMGGLPVCLLPPSYQLKN